MRRSSRWVIVLSCAAAAWPATASGQEGGGGAGLRPDGTLLVGQSLSDVEDGRYGEATVIAAVRPDGTLDPAYGRQGAARAPHEHVSDVAVAADGSARVLTRRAVFCNVDGCDFHTDLQRFDPAGGLAGATLVAETGRNEGGAPDLNRLVPSGDGVVERLGFSGAPEFATLERRGADGSLLADGGAGTDEAPAGERIAATPEGGALIAEGDDLVKLDAALEPVAAFGEGGRAPLPWDRAWESAVPAADGPAQVVLGGPWGALQVVRLRADGSPDPGFGDGGIVSLPEALHFGSALVVRSDGSILAGGYGKLDAFVVVRITPSGEVDDDFGDGGVATVDFDGDFEVLTDLVRLPEGGVVAAGVTSYDLPDANGVGRARLAVARLTSDGDLASKASPYVDVVAPGLSFDEAPAEGSVVDHRAVRFAASTPDRDATVECALNKGPRVPCDEPVVFEDLPAGSTRVDAFATDAAGNERTATRFFKVAPETRFTAGPADGSGATASFAWESVTKPSVSEAEDEFYLCRLDGGEWRSCTSTSEVSGLADGRHAFEVRQYSNSGLRIEEPEPARWEWRVGPEPKGDPGPGPATGGGAPPAPLAPPTVVPPTVEQRRAAAAAGLRAVASRPKRRARRVVVTVASAVPAAVRVTATVKVPRRRRALAVRAFGGGVQAGGTVKATLALGKRSRALVRRRGSGTLTAKVVLTGADGVELVTRTVKVRLRR